MTFYYLKVVKTNPHLHILLATRGSLLLQSSFPFIFQVKVYFENSCSRCLQGYPIRHLIDHYFELQQYC